MNFDPAVARNLDPSDVEGGFGTGLSIAAPALSAVPYVGPALTALASIGGGLLKGDAAKKQAARAAALRAQQVPLQGVAPAYQRKLNLDEMTALAGTPGYNQAKSDLDASTAQNLRAIADRSPSGGATLEAMGNALYQKNLGLQKLDAANAAYRAAGQGNVSADLATIGGQEDSKLVQQHADIALNQAGAANLENAATSNKYGGINQVVNAVGALGKLNFGGGNNTANNPNYLAYLKKQGYMIDASGKIVPMGSNVSGSGGAGNVTQIAGGSGGATGVKAKEGSDYTQDDDWDYSGIMGDN